MFLLRSWQESLKLFLPSNFKLFMLTVFKSAIETYGYLVYHFWWLVLIFAIASIGSVAPEFLIAEHVQWAQQIFWLIEPVIWLVLILLIRPSVREKGPAYFIAEGKKLALGFLAYIYFWGSFWGYDIGSSMFGLNMRFHIGNVLLAAIYRLGELEQAVNHIPILTELLQIKNVALHIYVMGAYFWLPLLLVPVFLYSVLFFADSEGSLRAWVGSLWRAIKMVIYNWPFFFISISLFGLIFLFIIVRISFITTGSLLTAAIIFFLLQPLIATYFKNFYVKRVHDQFKLYFPGT
jgi:hypothetical protein